MIVEKDGRFIIHCDNCDEEFDTEKDDHEEAVQEALNAGWKITTRQQYCDQCAEDAEND